MNHKQQIKKLKNYKATINLLAESRIDATEWLDQLRNRKLINGWDQLEEEKG